MSKKARNTDALRYIHERHIESSPGRRKQFEEAFFFAVLAQQIYALRTAAGLSQKQLADYLVCDVKVVNRIVNNRTALSATMALKLAAAFGTSPEFWSNAQKAVDIYNAMKQLKKLPHRLSVMCKQAA